MTVIAPSSGAAAWPSANEPSSATMIAITGIAVLSMAIERPVMMFVAGPVVDASAISFTGLQEPEV